MGIKELESTLDNARNLLTTLSNLILNIHDEELVHHACDAIYKASGGMAASLKGESGVVKIQFKSSGLAEDSGPFINQVMDYESSGNSRLLLQAAEQRFKFIS